jgi:hypothetical protein
MAGDPVIGHILDERAADLASGPRAQEGAQDWFVTRLSTHQPSFGPRDPSTRGVLRYSRECVEVEFCELRHNGVLGSCARPCNPAYLVALYNAAGLTSPAPL